MSLRRWKVVAFAGMLLSAVVPRLTAQQIDTGAALSALREAARACQDDNGTTWGKSLCGPIALVDRKWGLVIANDSMFRQRSRSFSTIATRRQSLNAVADWECFHCLATSSNAEQPLICIARSPIRANSGRSGCASFADIRPAKRTR